MPAQSSGKFYFEIMLIDGHGSFDAMGLITSGTSYNTFGIAGGSNCVAVSRSGVININSVNSGNIGAFTAGVDVLGPIKFGAAAMLATGMLLGVPTRPPAQAD